MAPRLSMHSATAAQHPMRMGWLLGVLLAVMALRPVVSWAAEAQVVVHTGPCNASTALPLGSGFFVVADDEEKPPVTLRLYRSGQGGKAVGEGTIPSPAVAPVDDGHLELDLEGSAQIGPLAYWIGSHGAAEGKGGKGKKKEDSGLVGEPRPNQQRLFATTLGVRADGKTMALTVVPMGRAYTTLIDDLAADPRYGRFGLAAAAQRPAKAKGGLNIEGLASTPKGALLIGFRNPLPEGKALLATLSNPNGVMGGEKAMFADPVLLDLGGQGIRSLERVNANLLIVAGPAEGSGGKTPPSTLYRWSEQLEQAPVKLRTFTPMAGESVNPEALFVQDNTLVVLSDDGNLERDGKACEDRPKAKQTFREIRLTPIP